MYFIKLPYFSKLKSLMEGNQFNIWYSIMLVLCWEYMFFLAKIALILRQVFFFCRNLTKKFVKKSFSFFPICVKIGSAGQ